VALGPVSRRTAARGVAGLGAVRDHRQDGGIVDDGGDGLLSALPGEPQDLTQTGSWTIVSGTGAFEGLRGSGEMEVTYDPNDDSLTHERLTGTVTP
jgi:hypothetical protein